MAGHLMQMSRKKVRTNVEAYCGVEERFQKELELKESREWGSTRRVALDNSSSPVALSMADHEGILGLVKMNRYQNLGRN